MNPERLLQNFDRLINTPDAVPRLRRFILDLAVRGKLVEQNPEDEPAAELLKRIEAEKKRLINNGVIRVPKSYELLNETEPLFNLPKTWKWVRLCDVGSIIGGGTPPSKDESCFTVGGKGIAWLTPADLGKHDDLFISHGARDLTEKGLATSSARLMPAGSVLFTSRAPIGYTAIAANKISTNQGFKSVLPYVSESNRYIAVYFNAFASWIDSKASGTTFREVSGKIVANLPFPLSPIAEQHRIVAKVEELMKLCDELEAEQAKRERRRNRLVAATLHGLNNGKVDNRNDESLSFEDSARFYFNHLPRLTTRPEHIQQLRQTILNLAVRGKLVPQDPKDEPAEKLLMRIENEKKRLVKSGAIKEAKPLSQIKVAEMLFIAPAGWKWTRLSDSVNSHLGGGTPSKGNATYWNGDIFWASVKDIGKTKYVDQTMDRITQAGLENSSSNLIPPGNLIVVTRMGLGKVSINRVPMAINQDLRALFLSSLTEIDYYYIFFKTASYEGKGLTVKGIKVEELLNFPFPLPPLAEQHRIVAKMYELMTLCDELETRVTTDITTNRKFLEVTLQEALSGANYGEEAIL